MAFKGGNILQRSILEGEAKKLLTEHFFFFFLVFLPILLLEIVSYLSDPQESLPNMSNWFWIGLAADIISGFLLDGVMLFAIDLFRAKAAFDSPFAKAFTIFSKAEYVIADFLISLLSGFFIFCWMLLLIVPGLIKSLSYSQAFFIYRDQLDKGERISYLQAITASRKLMDGHKAEYFVMSLSFIGWIFLFSIPLGIANVQNAPLLLKIICGLIAVVATVWFIAYYHLSFANFYKTLAAENSGETND